MELKKNQLITLHIDAVSSNGSGIGRYKEEGDSDREEKGWRYLCPLPL